MDHQKLSKIHIRKWCCFVFLLFLVSIGCVANFRLITFFMGTWCAFYGWWFLQVSWSSFLLMWYSICWCCLNVLLGRCCCFFDVSQTFLNSLWHHVTSFIGFTSSQHKHANPTSGGDQSYPLTLAANLAEPSYVHSGVYQETSLAKVVQWTMEQTEITINHDQHIMNRPPSVLIIYFLSALTRCKRTWRLNGIITLFFFRMQTSKLYSTLEIKSSISRRCLGGHRFGKKAHEANEVGNCFFANFLFAEWFNSIFANNIKKYM